MESQKTSGQRVFRLNLIRNSDTQPCASVISSTKTGIMRTVWLKWRPLLAGAIIVSFLMLLHLLHSSHSWNLCGLEYQTDRQNQAAKAYCNFPVDGAVHGGEGEVTTMKDGSGLRLVSVHTIIRHGDRDNLHSLPNYQNPKITCSMNDVVRLHFPVIGDYENIMKDNIRRGGRGSDQTFHGYDLYPKTEVCSAGLLTPEGALQHILIGQLFKQKYLLKHNLLMMQDFEESVFVRSTEYPRTYQSALALLFGFLPKLEVEKISMEVADNNTMCTANSGYPCACPAVQPYMDTMSATHRIRRPEIRDGPLGKDLYDHLAEVLEVDRDTLPPASHIMDVSMVHLCHNLPLPTGPSGSCMKPWSIGTVYDILAKNGQQQLKDFSRIARLKFQPLLHEIAERMLQQTMGKSANRFALYAGHDTTIEPIAAALNFSGGIWSPYASRIVFELYSPQDKSSDTPHSIRVLYNGVVVTKQIPFCKDSMIDAYLGLCPLERFIKFVRKYNLSEMGASQYKEACSNLEEAS